jgi:hypothetical protein
MPSAELKIWHNPRCCGLVGSGHFSVTIEQLWCNLLTCASYFEKVDHLNLAKLLAARLHVPKC